MLEYNTAQLILANISGLRTCHFAEVTDKILYCSVRKNNVLCVECFIIRWRQKIPSGVLEAAAVWKHAVWTTGCDQHINLTFSCYWGKTFMRKYVFFLKSIATSFLSNFKTNRCLYYLFDWAFVFLVMGMFLLQSIITISVLSFLLQMFLETLLADKVHVSKQIKPRNTNWSKEV